MVQSMQGEKKGGKPYIITRYSAQIQRCVGQRSIYHIWASVYICIAHHTYIASSARDLAAHNLMPRRSTPPRHLGIAGQPLSFAVWEKGF